ncbi:MAG TPA: carboxypeptidase-like regulatory domain-containing protein [Clostridia bacterium]|nr:carboxypeptidase-like regulatory domain-containing protein [Clostridia bacterium]
MIALFTSTAAAQQELPHAECFSEKVEYGEEIHTQRMEGIVSIRPDREYPLEGAMLAIRGPLPETEIRQTLTDKKGRFRFRGLRAGRYQFMLSKESGFTCTVGVIEVSKHARDKHLTLPLALGY